MDHFEAENKHLKKHIKDLLNAPVLVLMYEHQFWAWTRFNLLIPTFLFQNNGLETSL